MEGKKNVKSESLLESEKQIAREDFCRGRIGPIHVL